MGRVYKWDFKLFSEGDKHGWSCTHVALITGCRKIFFILLLSASCIHSFLHAHFYNTATPLPCDVSLQPLNKSILKGDMQTIPYFTLVDKFNIITNRLKMQTFICRIYCRELLSWTASGVAMFAKYLLEKIELMHLYIVYMKNSPWMETLSLHFFFAYTSLRDTNDLTFNVILWDVNDYEYTSSELFYQRN